MLILWGKCLTRQTWVDESNLGLLVLTGFSGDSGSVRTMDLVWLRRSPGLWEALMRICTAPWAAPVSWLGWIKGGCVPGPAMLVILWTYESRGVARVF